jgi:hypothetical protein
MDSGRHYFPCTWDQNDALMWEFNGNDGHGPVERTWHIQPKLDVGKVRQAWKNVLSENPALTVDYCLGKDGFWCQAPSPSEEFDKYIVEVPYCSPSTHGLIVSQTGALKDRIHTLMIDARDDETIVTFIVDHIPIDGYSFRRITTDFGKYLSGAAYTGIRDERFFEFCDQHGARCETCGPLAVGSVITPYESIPRSLNPANPDLCATAIRKYALPVSKIPQSCHRIMAGIAPAIAAAAVRRAAAELTSEVPTLVTLPGRRPATYDAFGRFLGYTMIGLPAAGRDILDTATKIYNRILAASKPSNSQPPMSRVVAALAPNRMSSKFKRPEQMLPYMAIDHSEPELQLVVSGHRVRAESADAAIFLGACTVCSCADAQNLSITVAIRTDHLSMSIFDTFDELLELFPSYLPVELNPKNGAIANAAYV